VLAECRHPVGIVTKSALIERDIDLLTDLARDGLVHVSLSLTTLDGTLARRLEPRASAPQRRLAAMRRLSEAGVPVGVMVAPIIPGLNDDELETLLAAARKVGACRADWQLVRLPGEVAGLFQQWLHTHYPGRAARVLSLITQMRGGALNDARFGRRMRGEGPLADLLAQRFRLACRRLGLDQDWPALRCELFQPPAMQASSIAQLKLF
jgi:DNA repair photolyase